MSQSESDFIIQPKYANNLPEVPSGPYFKDTKPYRKFEDFAKYNFSSLERSYVWHPHFGPEAGIKLDLWDQESILVHSTKDSLPHEDLKYLASAAAAKGFQSQEEKPWWLRNTTYLENANLDQKFTQEVKVSKKTLGRQDILSKIDQSFEDVRKITEKLSANEKKRVASVHEIFPDEEMWLQNVILAHFEVPSEVLETSIEGNKLHIDRSILTNFRQIGTKQTNGKEVRWSSLVCPIVTPEEDMHADSIEYSHVKEFGVNNKAAEKSSFMFTFKNGHLQYCPTRSNLQLKRIQYEREDEQFVHKATVKRRRQTVGEEEESSKSMKELLTM